MQNSIPAHFSKEETLNNFWGLIQETTIRFADKEFIVTRNGELNYYEANQRANGVYMALTNMGITSKIGIGLLLNDPLKIVPCMIGSLKAGCYFAPFDVTFPETTLKSVIETAEIKVIVTDNDHYLLAKLLANNTITIINYDELNNKNWIPDPLVKYAPDDWVQILFTSGSTGKPKGAIETYRYLAFAAYIKCTTRKHDSTDRVLQLSNFTFSGPHTLVFGALMLGMTICYYNVKEYGFIGLADWIRKEKITWFTSTATTFRTWVGTLKPEDQFPTVKFGHVGAEKVLHRDIENLRKYFPNLKQFQVGFASTETQSVTTSFFPVSYKFGVGELPCGAPHEGIKVFIWDENGNEQPHDKEGEIVVYSDTMARGYVNNSELTREKFIPDLKNSTYQYYKTGDRGKLRKDGQLVHLGRLDNMVKIKGVRIELNSLETHMLDYPGIVQVAFNVIEDRKGNKKLAAYFSAEMDIQIPVSDLRKFLTERIPVHLLPHYFIQLEQFPITRTGKLARDQLPRPEMTRPRLTNPYVPPANDLEATLVRVWEKEIGIEGIGVTDDFFDVGGDSLIGVLLFIQIEQQLQRNLPVTTLLSAATIRKQAEIISSPNIRQDFSPIITIRSQGNLSPLFFIPGKVGYPIRIRHLAEKINQETPIYALQNLSEHTGNRPFRQIESIATFYINEIRKVVPYGPYILVGESMGGCIALEMAQQLSILGKEVPILVMLDTYNFETRVKEEGWEYYWMLAGKHLSILLRSNWSGKLEYLKFYWNVYREKLFSFLKQRKDYLHKNEYRTFMQARIQIERINVAAARRYQPRPYSGKVILFKALRGPNAGKPSNGWDQVKIGELVIHELDCYHGSILFEPAVSKLAQTLNEYLQK